MTRATPPGHVPGCLVAGLVIGAVLAGANPAHASGWVGLVSAWRLTELTDTPAEPTEPTGLLTVVPVPGDSTSAFGYREHPIMHRIRYHAGIDLEARRGTLVRAAGPGMVVHAGRMGGYGNMVIIDHGRGLETRYAHLARFDVKVGDYVSAGQVVAEVGSTGRATGPHLHFEVRRWGRPIDPDSELAIHRRAIARGAGI